MEYEKIAGAAVQAMTAADLHRFLVVCALVSDLYCPGYNPKQSLAKDSNLARTAMRYKVDAAKTAASVRAELSKPKNAEKDETKPAKKLAASTARKTKNAIRNGSKQIHNIINPRRGRVFSAASSVGRGRNC